MLLCSTLIRGLENWRIRFLMSRTGYTLGQQVAAEKKAFCEVVRECTRVRPRIEMFQLVVTGLV